MAKTGIGIEVDIEGMVKGLDNIATKAMPRAAAYMLNGAAFAAQRELTAQVDESFDRPKAFTRKAFVVVKAKPGDGLESMHSIVRAKDKQAAYLKLQIEGGERRPGDPGAGGAVDVMTYGIRTDAYGGLARGLAKRLSADLKKERAARAAKAATRPNKRAASYSAENRAAGIFFATVHGIRGYWRRPKRKLSQVLGKLTLLLKMQDSAHYKPRFPYDETIKESFDLNANRTAFAKALDNEVRYQIEKASTPSKASFRKPYFVKK